MRRLLGTICVEARAARRGATDGDDASLTRRLSLAATRTVAAIDDLNRDLVAHAWTLKEAA
ncbi:MAG: hypothetical protein JOZ35_06785 [Hyphomicrobiales bacterium]|nr:hypothetical protein [Hyphomicrobiales bacterium]